MSTNRPSLNPHFNLVKNKKTKFSATMPQFQDQSHHSSDKSSHDSSLQRQNSNISEIQDEVEESRSSGSSETQSSKEESVKEEQSDSKENIQEQSQSSQKNEQKSKQQVIIQPQSITKKQVNPNPIQASYVSYHELSQQIPQQQVETDDIDSNDANNVVVQIIRGEPESERNSNEVEEDDEPNEQKVQKIVEQQKQHQEKKVNLKLPDNTMNEKFNQKPQPENMSHEYQQKKKQKKNKNKIKFKNKKTKLHNLPQHDNIQKRLQIMDILAEEGQRRLPQASQQQASKNPHDINPEQDEQQESINPFYEYIHPYLMLVGSSVIQSYMSKKPSYRANQASQWASELSSKVLLKAYFDSLDEPQNFEQKKNKSVKNSIIQAKIQENKFYRKLQIELNQLAQSQSFSQIPLSKIYLLIKKFKIIASCIILEKKSRTEVSVNISSSSYWNKQKDGQINFSYEGKNCFVMLTLYGVENTRPQQNQEKESKSQKRR